MSPSGIETAEVVSVLQRVDAPPRPSAESLSNGDFPMVARSDRAVEMVRNNPDKQSENGLLNGNEASEILVSFFAGSGYEGKRYIRMGKFAGRRPVDLCR